MSAPATGRFATEQGEKLLRGVAAQIARTIRSHGVKDVHDLRVAIRRFMRLLVVLKPCFPRGESRRIRRGLKRIMVQAGTVRDHDIAIRLLSRMAGGFAPQFREGRDEAVQTLIASLRRWVQRNLAEAWLAALKGGRDHKSADARFRATPVDAAAKRLLPAMAAEHFRLGKDAVGDRASVKEIHRFRIAARNLRYALELFATLGGTAPGQLDQFRDVQTRLGDIHDCATVRRMLSRRKSSRGDKEILAALRKRQRKKTEQFQRRYADEFAGKAKHRR